jgi:hypothetical protein
MLVASNRYWSPKPLDTLGRNMHVAVKLRQCSLLHPTKPDNENPGKHNKYAGCPNAGKEEQPRPAPFAPQRCGYIGLLRLLLLARLNQRHDQQQDNAEPVISTERRRYGPRRGVEIP